MEYEKPSLTTDVVALRVKKQETDDKRKLDKLELQILLLNRDSKPYKGFLSLPGGFVDIRETIIENAKRKMREKTGVSGNYFIEQLYTRDRNNAGQERDSRGWIVTVSHIALLNEETYIEEGSIREYGWYNVEEILNGLHGDLAFDHIEIIQDALERIANKIEYTDIAFNLLPSEFTVAELKNIYELILNREILNFRRKINEYLKPLNKKVSGTQFRPAELFSLNKERNNLF